MYRGDHRSSRNKDSNEIIEVFPTLHPTRTPEAPDPPGPPVTGSQRSRPSCFLRAAVEAHVPPAVRTASEHVSQPGVLPPPAVRLRGRPDQDGWACHILVGSATSLHVTNVPELTQLSRG